MSLSYQDPTMDHDEAAYLLSNGNAMEIISALVSIGLNDPDWKWAQDSCLQCLNSDHENVVASAVTALGHIARRHEQLDLAQVYMALAQAKEKFPSLTGTITDTQDDIEIFITSN